MKKIILVICICTVILTEMMNNITCMAEDKFTTMTISIDIGSDTMYIDGSPVDIENRQVNDIHKNKILDM